MKCFDGCKRSARRPEKMPLSGALPITAATLLPQSAVLSGSLNARGAVALSGRFTSLMGQNFALVIRDDHTDALIMRLDDFAELAK